MIKMVRAEKHSCVCANTEYHVTEMDEAWDEATERKALKLKQGLWSAHLLDLLDLGTLFPHSFISPPCKFILYLTVHIPFTSSLLLLSIWPTALI